MRRRPGKGFTLVELLVAMAILSALMVMLFTFFDQATKAWQNSEKRVDAFREARVALYYLQRDLRGLVVTTNFSTNNLYLDLGGTTVPSSADTNGGDIVFFLARQSDQAQPGNRSDLCAVGYYVAWTTVDGKSSYNLYRYFRGGDATFRDGSYGLSNYLMGGTGLFAPASFLGANADEVVARNVVNFRIKLYGAATNLLPAGRHTEAPSWGEVSLTAYNRASSARLRERSDWLARTNLEKEGHSFHLRMALNTEGR